MKYSFIYLLLFFLCACSYRVEKETETLSLKAVGFAEVQSAVFAPKCSRCHAWASAGVYEGVLSHLQEMNIRVQSVGADMMPPSTATALTANEKNLVVAWIAKGAPREANGPGQAIDPSLPPPSPPQAPEKPLPPANVILGFEEIKSAVFAPKCLRCHAGLMATYESLAPSLNELQRRISLMPNDPMAIDIMPPTRAPGLTAEEKDLILNWINIGAPKSSSTFLANDLPQNKNSEDTNIQVDGKIQ